MKPCPCEPVRARTGPYTPDQCPVCWRALNVTEYAAAWGYPPPAEPIALPRPARALGGAGRPSPPAPCRYRGDELAIAEVQAAGLDARRRWHLCERLGFAREGQPANGCTGCGPKCPGYEA